jgi:hypothetical protein
VAAGYLLSDRVAGAVVGVVTAMAGVVGARGRSLLDRRFERRAALPDEVIGGRLARVREVTDPVMLGVHPAAADDTGHVPPYIGRDFDHSLDQAIRAGGFVLLTGESTAGKSRAYEAMRRLLPDHLLIAPVRNSSPTLLARPIARIVRRNRPLLPRVA